MFALPHSSLTTRALAELPQAPEIARFTHAVTDACGRVRHGSSRRIHELTFFSVFTGGTWMDEHSSIEPEYQNLVGDIVFQDRALNFAVIPDLNKLAVHYSTMPKARYQVITPTVAYYKFGPESKRNIWEPLLSALLNK
jgi:hypothetical protein